MGLIRIVTSDCDIGGRTFSLSAPDVFMLINPSNDNGSGVTHRVLRGASHFRGLIYCAAGSPATIRVGS